MNSDRAQSIRTAEVVLPCAELDPTLEFFTKRFGFRVDAIIPADSPSVVVISGHGLRLRLQREGSGDPGTIRLCCDDPAQLADGASELTAPNGTRVELVAADPELVIPPSEQTFVLTRMSGDSHWGVGRAGMRYRDLIPDRLGGRFIASHIQIPGGGLVPDYVHFHKVRFQMIYCYKGWVRVAYEDQGPPRMMNAGDCFLQPPEIRHRVLECSDGLEVIEIGCPAEHETRADHELLLPTPELQPERDFGGQRFIHHVAAEAEWQPWRCSGFEFRDIGIGGATDGLAGVRVVRSADASSMPMSSHDAEFLFMFVLHGTASLQREGQKSEQLSAGDSFVMPAQMPHGLTDCAGDLALLEVSLPAEI